MSSFWSKIKHYFRGDYSEWANNVNRKILQETGESIPGVSDPFNTANNAVTGAINAELEGAEGNTLIGKLFGSSFMKDLFNGIASVMDPQGAANRAFQKDENELAYKRQLELMNYQNDYNTPQAQMQRLAEAGLNPNLMYGQGTTGNTAVSSPEYHPTQSDLSYNALETAARGIALYHNIQLQKEQVDNVKAQTDLANNRAAHEAVMTALGQERYKVESELLQYQLGLAKERARKEQIFNDLREPKVKYAENEAKLDYMSKKLGISPKMLEAALADEGLTTRDNMWIRLVYNILSERRDNSMFGGLYNKFKNHVLEYLNKTPYDRLSKEDKDIWDSIREEEDNELFYREYQMN